MGKSWAKHKYLLVNNHKLYSYIFFINFTFACIELLSFWSKISLLTYGKVIRKCLMGFKYSKQRQKQTWQQQNTSVHSRDECVSLTWYNTLMCEGKQTSRMHCGRGGLTFTQTLSEYYQAKCSQTKAFKVMRRKSRETVDEVRRSPSPSCRSLLILILPRKKCFRVARPLRLAGPSMSKKSGSFCHSHKETFWDQAIYLGCFHTTSAG